VALHQKLFPELSEDVWLLYAEGFGRHTDRINFVQAGAFVPSQKPPAARETISLGDWKSWNFRLRSLLLPRPIRQLYR
jgi:hypothetical protein